MSNMRSIVSSSNLTDVIKALGSLQPEDAERIALPWLQTGLRVTARDPKATCRFGATLATYTDLHTRQTVLSPLAMRAATDTRGYGRDNGYLVTLGFMFHEAGHLRYSDATHAAIVARYGATKDKGLALMLSNLLDDERLERWYMNQYPGTRNAIDAARRYMSGSYNNLGRYQHTTNETNPHPKQPEYPRDITSRADVIKIVTLAVAYDNHVTKPATYFRTVRRCYISTRQVLNPGLSEGPETDEATVVATHLVQVERLIRLVKRYSKGLPNQPEPEQPEPETGDEPGEDEGEDEGPGGWDEGEDEGDESESGASTSEPGDEVDEDATGPEGDDGDEPGEDGEGDESDDEAEGDDESSSGSGSESDGPTSESDTDGEGKDSGHGQQDGDEGWDDIHAPGGHGAGAGKVDLDKMAEDMNQRLDDIVKDPFIHDRDIMTDGTLTGTIERNPETGGVTWNREVGEADPYLTDVMREAFLSTRFSHESYTTGYTRGRLRTRDACKAPAGVANLFSQRSDASVTRARLTIMLDYSGSMGSLLQRSDTFFRSLADATTHIGAVRIGAWTYESNDLVALWESQEGEHVLAERLHHRYSGGGTGTAACLGMLVDEVERTALPGERQVILSITDGAPNEGPAAVRNVVEDARESGIAVLGVNIGLSNPHPHYVEMFRRTTEEQYGDDAITWNAGPEAWADLGDEVLTMVGEVLAGARTF